MLQKLKPNGSLVGSLLDRAVRKAKNMYKSEELAYQGAFLAHVRTTLLPYLQQATRDGSVSLPDAETEESLL